MYFSMMIFIKNNVRSKIYYNHKNWVEVVGTLLAWCTKIKEINQILFYY